MILLILFNTFDHDLYSLRHPVCCGLTNFNLLDHIFVARVSTIFGEFFQHLISLTRTFLSFYLSPTISLFLSLSLSFLYIVVCVLNSSTHFIESVQMYPLTAIILHFVFILKYTNLLPFSDRIPSLSHQDFAPSECFTNLILQSILID